MKFPNNIPPRFLFVKPNIILRYIFLLFLFFIYACLNKTKWIIFCRFRSSQKNQARAAKLRSIETEFYKYVDAEKTATFLDIDFETTEAMFYYWKLKRRVSKYKRSN